MSVRAKFHLTQIVDTVWGQKKLVFNCQYDSSIPEDRRFQKATPSGQIEMVVDNPAAVAQFELGEYYYADFTRVPKPEAA